MSWLGGVESEGNQERMVGESSCMPDRLGVTQILSLHFGDCTPRRPQISLRGDAGTDKLSDPLVSSYYAPFRARGCLVVFVQDSCNSKLVAAGSFAQVRLPFRSLLAEARITGRYGFQALAE